MAIIPTIEIETTLQERLDAPTVWKDVLKVKYTNTGILKNPFLDDATVYTGTRGTGYDSTAVATQDDSVTINTYVGTSQHIDDADLAQKTFSDFMEIAENMGTMLNEKVETQMLAEHAQWTNFDNASIGGAAGNITVSVSNIKTIIGAMKTAIRTAGGGDMLARNGGFIVWRESDYEKVEALASAEGFNTADMVLKNGISQVNGGFVYLGITHYSSSKHAAGHVFGGVKEAFMVGIVKSTYGRVKTIINPVVAQKQISGVGLESRVDNKFVAWTKMVPVLFDILVA